MRALRRFLIRLTASVTRRRDDERLREELEDHIALQTDENMRAGMPAAEARRQAVLKFGAVEAIREDYRDEQGLPFVEHLLQDARIALRRMKQAPGFTAAAVAILALGLGLTSAVASLAYALFLKPLPVDDASQVVFVGAAGERPARLSGVLSRLPLLSRSRARVRRSGRALLDVAHERRHAGRSRSTCPAAWSRPTTSICCACSRRWAGSSCRTRIACPAGIPSPC